MKTSADSSAFLLMAKPLALSAAALPSVFPSIIPTKHQRYGKTRDKPQVHWSAEKQIGRQDHPCFPPQRETPTVHHTWRAPASQHKNSSACMPASLSHSCHLISHRIQRKIQQMKACTGVIWPDFANCWDCVLQLLSGASQPKPREASPGLNAQDLQHLDTKMQVHFLLLHLHVSAAVPEPWWEAMADENHLALIYCFKDTSTTEYLFIEPHYIIFVVPICKLKCNQKHIPKKQHWQKYTWRREEPYHGIVDPASCKA